jgi:hypothetical protein
LNLEKQRIGLEMKNRKFEMATKEAQLAQGAAVQTPVAQAQGADFGSQAPPPGMGADEAAYILPETQVPRTSVQIQDTPSGQPINLPLKYQEQVAEEKEAAGLASGDLVRDAQGNVISERRAIAGENAAARASQAQEAAAARAAQQAQHDATLVAIAGLRNPDNKPPTGKETDAMGYYKRAAEAIVDAESLQPEISKLGLIGQARLQYGPNFTQSETEQQYRQAQRAFTEARLRKESGAAIPAAEYENDAKTYFYQPGDGPKVTAQKERRRQDVLESLRIGAGRAYTQYTGEDKPTAANAPAAKEAEAQWERGPDGKPRRKK